MHRVLPAPGLPSASNHTPVAQPQACHVASTRVGASPGSAGLGEPAEEVWQFLEATERTGEAPSVLSTG